MIGGKYFMLKKIVRPLRAARNMFCRSPVGKVSSSISRNVTIVCLLREFDFVRDLCQKKRNRKRSSKTADKMFFAPSHDRNVTFGRTARVLRDFAREENIAGKITEQGGKEHRHVEPLKQQGLLRDPSH